MTGPVAPYRGRRLDPEVPVEVYRNLNRGGYSVRQGGRVVGHTSSVTLRDVTFMVNRASWKRARAEGRRNVHAWASGSLQGDGVMFRPEERQDPPTVFLAPVKYHRGRGAFLMNRRRIVWTRWLYLDADGAKADFTHAYVDPN